MRVMKKFLEKEIFEELCEIPTIDAHEHLPTEREHLGKPHDFYSLFEHYCAGDLIAAGAGNDDMHFFADRSRPLQERWKRFSPLFSRIRTGSYARAALISAKDLLGISDLDDSTYEELSLKLQDFNSPGIYDKVLKERCNISACIECWRFGESPYPDYFFHLAHGPELIDLVSKDALEKLSAKYDLHIHKLEDLLACMDKVVGIWRAAPEIAGVKSAHAYSRSIDFKMVSSNDAERLLGRILRGENISGAENVQFQDFLVFELLARLHAVRLPMAFHTGLQAGNFNKISNANPLLLQPLIRNFPDARIDLFHGGMPWVRETAVLAKYFPGVHLNMAWMHIISPAQARSALSEWLDMVPNSKIFGFGGDYKIVEKVYGHLKLARENIAAVLAEKVGAKAISRSDASMLARRLMRENPQNFYSLPENIGKS